MGNEIEKINGIKTDTGWRLTTILAVIKDVISNTELCIRLKKQEAMAGRAAGVQAKEVANASAADQEKK